MVFLLMKHIHRVVVSYTNNIKQQCSITNYFVISNTNIGICILQAGLRVIK